AAADRSAEARRAASAIPFRLTAVDAKVRLVSALIEADRIEDEELRLGTEVRGVGDRGAEQVVDRLASDVARIAAVVLARQRIENVPDQHHRRRFGKGIEKGG